MNLLREYIRAALLAESVDLKIMSMIDTLESKGGYVEVRPDRVIIWETSKNPERQQYRWVAMVAYDTVVGAHAGGRCGGAESVVQSATAKTGLGPLAYDVAIELTGGLGMVSDRSSVSSDARAVWDYYMNNRPDVIKQQLDNTEDLLTPEKYDNCEQEIEGTGGTAVDMFPDNPRAWVKSSLSKLYKKMGTPVMDELRKRGMLK